MFNTYKICYFPKANIVFTHSQLGWGHLVGTFTTDIITATLSGDFTTTDTNGIVVTRTSSPTSTPTLSPTSTPTVSSTPPPTSPEDLGSVRLVRGLSWLTSSGDETPITSQSQVGAGTKVRTGSNAIVEFTYPDEGGVVCLGENTEVGWVALESHPAPDGQVSFTVYPSDVEHQFNWAEEGKELLKWTAAGATIELLLTGAINPYLVGAEVVVHGGVILLHYGQFYVKENGWPQLVQVAQGYIQGKNTEYTITVSNDTTVIQVIDGPVVFLDAVTHDYITVNTNQVLTLPAGQQNGFSQQELQSDVSAFNQTSVDQWWTQATANTSPLSFLTDQPEILAVLIFVIVIGITVPVVAVSKRRKKEFAQPGVKKASGMYVGKRISKERLIAQSILALVAFVVIGYFIITLINSEIVLDEELGMGISFSMFMEAMIITVFVVGYIVGLAQQIRMYRRQESRMPSPPPSTLTGEIKGPTYNMASGSFAQPVPQPSTLACPNCGKQLTTTKNFCPYCGFQFKTQDSGSHDSL